MLHEAYQCTKHKECKYAKAKSFAEGDSFDKIVNTMDSSGCLTVTLKLHFVMVASLVFQGNEMPVFSFTRDCFLLKVNTV